MKLQLLSYAAVGMIVGCSSAPLSNLSDDTTSNITVGLVDSSRLSMSLADGYEISVTARNGDCEGYESSGSLVSSRHSFWLDTACEYSVVARIGAMGAAGMETVYFETPQGYVVNQGHLNDHVRFSPVMQATDAAAGAGFTETDTASAQPVLLSAAQNQSLRGLAGSTTLEEHFRGEYMMIELSQRGCPYCVDLARAHGSDMEFTEIVNSGSCSVTTVVPRLSPWLSLGFEDVVRNNSFEGNHSSTANAFSTAFSGGIPFVFIIDRSGNRVWPESNTTQAYYQRAAAMARFKELCR